MNNAEQITTIAKGISDYGMMIIICACFLVVSIGLMLACFRWFKTLIDGIIGQYADTMDNLLNETRIQNEKLDHISEGLMPETQLRIKSTSNAFFDLAVERVCRIIKKVREENHIADHESTRRKIHTLIENLHEDRNSKFDCYTYRGRKLSAYTSAEWVDWVAQVVECEVYSATVNNGRAYTNVSAVYERIKLDFYHRNTHI